MIVTGTHKPIYRPWTEPIELGRPIKFPFLLKVNVYRFITENTIEEKIIER
jgi:SWI/SNF-related matrix-associated actin-dependent regulator of chromatin subfamily A member 5